jgi:glycerol dehydrogenase-like iron-containing ADH family enzyme
MEKKTKSSGLGDTVAKITAAIGLDKVAETVAKAMGKEDCGCKRRQEKLNELVPYKNQDKQS